ncbi:hypothetical protein J7399_19685 [Shimia sp. R9_1]|uniref:hypothetical protein n=1 Tax=Shimia sp. R9_1 TaxID=2821111 RepID=UPI001ADB39AA|nr:hypothetical protein [Shimia sp. R9_1]MBO9409668.1 hypothetical protein [Shimia sp. R9_1]
MRTLWVFDDHVYLVRDGAGIPSSAEEFLEPIKRTGSLRALKEVFPARRGALLGALERFGFDFDSLLREDFELGHSDVQIARRHGVDAKWIQAQRRRLGVPAHMGRPSKHPSDAELAEVFRETKRNYSEAAKRL